MRLRVPMIVLCAVAVAIPALACNALKRSGAGDAGAPSSSASTITSTSATADVDASLPPLADAAPPRYVVPLPAPPKPDPEICKQARALRASGNASWQKLATQCTAQGGKM